VDLVLTDPPYNISQDGIQLGRTNMRIGVYRRDMPIKLDFGEWDKMEDKEYFDFTESWFSECARLAQQGSWLCSFFAKQKTGFFDLLLAPKYGIKAKTILIWLKTNPTPQFRKQNFTSASEFIWCGVKGQGSIPNFGKQTEMGNFFWYPNASVYGETEHSTEKPAHIISQIIGFLSNSNNLILDPFLGSGTTCYCAKKLGRKCIGIEISEEYCHIAATRCSQAVMDLSSTPSNIRNDTGLANSDRQPSLLEKD